MAETVHLPLGSLTLGDLEEIDELIAPLTLAGLDLKALPFKVVTRLIYFVKHKTDPSVTLAMVQALTLSEVTLDLGDAPDPTDAATSAT